ncbi:MAG: hypothetical protein JWQ84_3037 [Mucilaginibacter sp.]|nr:hypothetical protein [Mucilaginibacter sp.]MDB5018205.1 hypothetical protein [Mucilaginibacter sp.]
MKLTTLTLALLLVSNLLLGQTDEKIIAIRKTVQHINSETGYKIKTLTNDYFADVKNEAADNGQELKGYYKDGELKKMVHSVGLSNCMKTYEYYFSGADLIFVFEKEADYPYKKGGFAFDYSKLVPAFEGRFYFEKGKIFKTLTKGKERSTDLNHNSTTANLKDLLDDLKKGKSD